MSHTEWQFMPDRELDRSLASAKSNVARSTVPEHVEYYESVVCSIMEEKRLRKIMECYDDGE